MNLSLASPTQPTTHSILLATHAFAKLPEVRTEEGAPASGVGPSTKKEDFKVWQEMLAGVRVLDQFLASSTTYHDFLSSAAPLIRSWTGDITVNGEGSSIKFPGNFARWVAIELGLPTTVQVFSSGDALEMSSFFERHIPIIISNSGKSAEPNGLKRAAVEQGVNPLIITATPSSPITQGIETRRLQVLTCGKEEAVAATKSVIETALLVLILTLRVGSRSDALSDETLRATQEAMQTALLTAPPKAAIDFIRKAQQVYVFGRDDGCAEELALKLLELTGIPGHYCAGNFSLHGPLEGYDDKNPQPILVVQKSPDFVKRLVSKQPQAPLIIIGSQEALDAAPETAVKILLPKIAQKGQVDLSPLVATTFGWRLFVEVGLARGANLDKPTKLTKVATSLE